MNNYIESLVTLGFLGGLMFGIMKFMLRDIHKDLIDIKSTQQNIKSAQEKSDARIDHLYEENNRLYRTLIDIIQKKSIPS